MSYKTERGNVAKKCLRFHATVKMVSDYQLVTKIPVAASRRQNIDIQQSTLDEARPAVAALEAWSPMTL